MHLVLRVSAFSLGTQVAAYDTPLRPSARNAIVRRLQCSRIDIMRIQDIERRSFYLRLIYALCFCGATDTNLLDVTALYRSANGSAIAVESDSRADPLCRCYRD